jgi:hypothetical protein
VALVLAVIVHLLRQRQTSKETLDIGRRGFLVTQPHAVPLAVAWRAIRSADLEQKDCWQWRFALKTGGEVMLREDAFTREQWKKLSGELQQAAAKKIPVRVVGAGQTSPRNLQQAYRTPAADGRIRRRDARERPAGEGNAGRVAANLRHVRQYFRVQRASSLIAYLRGRRTPAARDGPVAVAGTAPWHALQVFLDRLEPRSSSAGSVAFIHWRFPASGNGCHFWKSPPRSPRSNAAW